MKNGMQPKGLTLSMVFEAESANYGESVGNVASLKKVARGKGEQYTYISRQAIRYNIVEQLGEACAEVRAEGSGDKKVIQFHPDATIKDYPEVDFFGYLKTMKGTGGKKRSAKVRLSNAISLETFKGDLDFLTNKGLADRIKENMNIAQAEIHKSYYRYTITADLEQIGIDEEYDIEIDNTEKARRVHKLLDTIALLYRDIRGRREDLKPLFAIGGVYDIKNPIFQNVLDVRDQRLIVEQIEGVLFENIKKDTYCGLIEGKFENDKEIKERLNPLSMPKLFETLKGKVKDYYEGH
ncbi:CRISPR-associated regulatory protein DevR family Cst2 [Clostridium aceticum]|uniref:CRISPR-associated regulatory protein DevR family Cst2 n=1 Tax=Clostridium aceticum TaxID=84022 RepID=A0A0D8I900_9CLOT|nr:type I-B CRISPR-associated protein Cas7/Cst2/DevR [Clostridium aceticum]AKL95673.1 CRISPR-associated regulatory protein DevR family Cst2 [Clostridium aceticum]KJF26765.1 CRISPR-associated protein [Clostridium aceticum]